MANSRLTADIAQALIRVAHEAKEVEAALTDVLTLDEVFREHPELLSSLRERAVPLAARAEALKGALAKTVSPFVLNALLTLQDQQLLADFPTFVSAVIEAAQDIAGHHKVDVRSAVPLESTEREELSRIIKKKFKGSHRLYETVDPRLLGGMVVQVGDWHVDASIKGKLERLTQALSV